MHPQENRVSQEEQEAVRTGDLERLERQAARMGCRVLSNEAWDALKRIEAESEERLEEVESLREEIGSRDNDIRVLRREVSILNFRLKTPWGRVVVRWKRRGLKSNTVRPQRPS